MEEYHDGSADTSLESKKIDDKTVEIEYKEIQATLQSGGGIRTYAAPETYVRRCSNREEHGIKSST